ncbi:helix-turn-helix transcriptional regulator, partial [Bacillus cereus]|uniref:helix-turn-helix domain-containing protein n=1 Tax=Bacillus cereus TaxID=1396 RepID=UPI001E636CDA
EEIQMNKDANERIAKMFIELQEKTGLTNRYVSKQLGIAENTIASWKNGKFAFSLKTLNKIESFIEKTNKFYDSL